MGGIIATAANKVHASALIVYVNATIASVESVFTAAVVGAMTSATWLSLLALVFLLATLAAARLTILVVLLWVLKHAGRRLVANSIAEHLDLPLHRIDGGVVVA